MRREQYVKPRISRPSERAQANERQRTIIITCSYALVRDRSLARTRLNAHLALHLARPPAGVSRGTRQRPSRSPVPLTRGTHILAPRVTHVLARREACRVSAHANKVELVPLRTRWLENNIRSVFVRGAVTERLVRERPLGFTWDSFPRRFAFT